MASKFAITGSGVYAPPNVLDNEELCSAFNTFVRHENQVHAKAIEAGSMEAYMESDPAFVERASGIKKRYVQDKAGILDPGQMRPSIKQRPDSQISLQAEYALNAAETALAQARRTGEEVDMVIFATSNPQRLYPSMGIELQSALGARGFGYDMSVGCASSMFGLQFGLDALRSGSAKCILLANPELMTGHANFRDRDSHFLFGDAAAALVLEPLENATASSRQLGHTFEILSTQLKSKYSNNIRNNAGFLNHCDPDSQFEADKLFHQQGRRVFKDVVPMAAEFLEQHLASEGLEAQQVKRYWLHQANVNMNDLIIKRLLGRTPTNGTAPMVIQEYGNTASSGCLITFHKYHQDLQPGDYGMISAFGAGYSLGSAIIRKV